MSILVDKNTKVITQGMTGETGTFHTEQALAYGTQMVGGVTPGKGGTTHIGLPVFDTVAEAVAATGATASVHLRAAALRRGLDPRGDRRRGAADRRDHRGHSGARHGQGQARAVGLEVAADRPELPRRADPRRVQDRHHARQHLHEGHRSASSSRSGTLTYEAVFQTTNAGLGQTTAVGIGGDPVNGTNFIDVLELFLADDATKSIIMIGEIGGDAEEEAAQFLDRRGEARPQQADGRLHRRPHRASGPPHGPCRRDRLGRQGRRRGQDRGDGSGWHPASPPSPSELGTTLLDVLKG